MDSSGWSGWGTFLGKRQRVADDATGSRDKVGQARDSRDRRGWQTYAIDDAAFALALGAFEGPHKRTRRVAE